MTHNRLLIIGPFPPKVTGFSAVTKAFKHEMAQRLPVAISNLSVHTELPRLVFHTKRTWLCLVACAQILSWRFRGGKSAYIGCNASLGIIYTALQLFCARLLPGKVYLHHHSFSYIHEDSRLIRMLLRCGQQDLIHIFLCCEMQKRFIERYGFVEAIVLQNSAFLPVQHVVPPRQPSEKVVVGLLSNLSREKGLYSFLEMLEEAARLKLPVAGYLAGPAEGDDREAIDAAIENPEVDLTYFGSVYEKDKDQFFRDIDVFVFPTEYRTEAQPLVVFEAQSYGRPVIARGIACIPGQLPDGLGCIPPDDSFVPAALEWLRKIALDGDLQDAQATTRRHYVSARKTALSMLDEIAK